LIATCLAVAFALWSPNIYRAEALLTPSLEQQGGGLSALASRFGGLASLAGVDLGNKGGDKASIAIEVGKSRLFLGELSPLTGSSSRRSGAWSISTATPRQGC